MSRKSISLSSKDSTLVTDLDDSAEKFSIGSTAESLTKLPNMEFLKTDNTKKLKNLRKARFFPERKNNFGPKLISKKIQRKDIAQSNVHLSKQNTILESMEGKKGMKQSLRTSNKSLVSFQSGLENSRSTSIAVFNNTNTSEMAKFEDRFYRNEKKTPIIGYHFKQDSKENLLKENLKIENSEDPGNELKGIIKDGDDLNTTGSKKGVCFARRVIVKTFNVKGRPANMFKNSN